MQELNAAWLAIPSGGDTGLANMLSVRALRELEPNPVRLQMHLTDVGCSK
jgi:hypothetical protein